MTGSALQRFVDAQDGGGTFTRALDELAAGRKRTHWMWFVFPQLAGLGTSATARRYALDSLDEAVRYLAHPVLGPRLRRAARAVLDVSGVSAEELLGPVDAQKLRSSMTLFHRAADSEELFVLVLDRYFDGVPDAATDALLGRRP